MPERKLSWSRFALFFLGVWLVIAPWTFAYKSHAMELNDILSGLLILFAVVGNWGIWLAALVGVWLQFAPLIFWAPSGMLYLNDTLVGVLAVCFTLLIPEAPAAGSPIPQGWNYNPSSFLQRAPIVLLAIACWFIARYMAAYQLGYRDTVYDPLFENGTLDVISSSISKDFPVSDAGLGAAAYTLEVLLGLHGGEQRWRTMPWTVLLFGVLIVPVGLVSILLVMLQPILIGHWCFWCLLIALLMLIMIALTVDEVIATLQYLGQVKRGKLPFWKTLWTGGRNLGHSKIPKHVSKVWICWNLILTGLIGIGFMALPGYFGTQGILADMHYIAGALVVTNSIISMAEVTRAWRFLNVPIAFWMIASAWVEPDTEMLICQVLLSLLLVLLSIPRGKINNHYGNWDKCIF